MLDQYIRRFKRKENINNSDDLNYYLNGLGVDEKEVLYTNYNWELENYFRNCSVNKNRYDNPVLIDKNDIKELEKLGFNIDLNDEEVFYYISF